MRSRRNACLPAVINCRGPYMDAQRVLFVPLFTRAQPNQGRATCFPNQRACRMQLPLAYYQGTDLGDALMTSNRTLAMVLDWRSKLVFGHGPLDLFGAP